MFYGVVKGVDDLQIKIEAAARKLILSKGMSKTITVEFDGSHQLVAGLGKSENYTANLYEYTEADGIGVYFHNELPACFTVVRIEIKRKFLIKMLAAIGEK